MASSSSLAKNSSFSFNLKETSSEQAFDICIINRGQSSWVKMIRVGAGYNRTFHLNAINMSINTELDINDSLVFNTPLSWGSNDLPGPIWSKENKRWFYTSSNVYVSDGIVKALQEGASIVYSEDSFHGKEFFLINVMAD